MIQLKTSQEIELMTEGGCKLRAVVEKLLPQIIPGITTNQIDDWAKRLIKEEGGELSFNQAYGYKWATCLPVNEQVVHTPPSDRILNQGDILTVDIGVFYKGFHTDYATTIIVGEKPYDKNNEMFLNVGQITLEKAINQAKQSEYLGEISAVIQKEIYGNGYFVLKDLTGHGIGRTLHEDPFIPGYLDRPVEKTYKIRPGLVVAIEIIYSMGTEQIANEKGNNWSIVSKDHSLTACFEHTIAFTGKNTLILT